MLGLPEQLWAACLLEDVVELVFLEYPLSVIRGLVHSLNCCRVAQICRKNCANVVGFLARIEWCLMMRRISKKKGGHVHGGSRARRGRSGGRRDSGWRNRGRSSVRKEQFFLLFVPQSISEETWRETAESQGGAEIVGQYQQWKEAKKKERAVELQEQAEVSAKVMKEQFDQTLFAFSPSLTTPPQFPHSPPAVPSLHLVAEGRRRKSDLCGAPQLQWIEAELLHKVS